MTGTEGGSPFVYVIMAQSFIYLSIHERWISDGKVLERRFRFCKKNSKLEGMVGTARENFSKSFARSPQYG